MLEIKNLSKVFTQQDGTQVSVLKNIDCTINAGEVICIIGPSGTGKSTFLRCLNGIEKATDGEIIFQEPQIRNCYRHGSFDIISAKSCLDLHQYTSV